MKTSPKFERLIERTAQRDMLASSLWMMKLEITDLATLNMLLTEDEKKLKGQLEVTLKRRFVSLRDLS